MARSYGWSPPHSHQISLIVYIKYVKYDHSGLNIDQIQIQIFEYNYNWCNTDIIYSRDAFLPFNIDYVGTESSSCVSDFSSVVRNKLL